MGERLLELQAILAEVRRRWTQRAVLRAWMFAAAAATTVLLAGLGAVVLVAREGVPLVLTVAIVSIAALFTAVVRAPLTGIILVMELTGCATLLLPMLSACFVAMLLPTLTRDRPIYDALT